MALDPYMIDLTQIADVWVKELALTPHPEGGYYRETYRSPETIRGTDLPSRYPESRPFSTAIYFLLKGTDFSSFHRIKSDEMWHYYAGSAMMITLISPEGQRSTMTLGNRIEKEESFQCVITAGHWFAAEVKNSKSFSLVGCTVAPGFDFADFELGKRADLIKLFPQHQEIIEKLTR